MIRRLTTTAVRTAATVAAAVAMATARNIASSNAAVTSSRAAWVISPMPIMPGIPAMCRIARSNRVGVLRKTARAIVSAPTATTSK